jgi:hypothetical protein
MDATAIVNSYQEKFKKLNALGRHAIIETDFEAACLACNSKVSRREKLNRVGD